MNCKKGVEIILGALKSRGMTEFEALKLLTMVVEGYDEFSEIPKAVSIPTENGGYPEDWHIVGIDTFKRYLEACETVSVWMLHAFYVCIKDIKNSHDSDGYMNVPKKYFMEWLKEDSKVIEIGEYKPLFYVAYDDTLKALWVYELKNAGEVKEYIKEMSTKELCVI